MKREGVRDGQIFLHALKNGAPIWLPLCQDVEFALQCSPAPRSAAMDCPYFFWNGLGSREAQVRNVKRTLQAVFAKSGVLAAYPHRIRHTLATEILVAGGGLEGAAKILGDTPEIVRQHYLKWSTAYQKRTVEIQAWFFGTPTAHVKKFASKAFNGLSWWTW